MQIAVVVGDAGRIAEIDSIARRTWPSAYGEILPPGQIEYMLGMMYSDEALREQMSSKQHRFVIAENMADAVAETVAEGVAESATEMGVASVGFASFQLDFPEPGTSKIHKLYVLPEAQQLGVGKRLVRYIRETVMATQHALTLNVNKNNRARSFYTRLGFQVVAEEVIDIGNGYLMDDVVMRWDFGQSG